MDDPFDLNGRGPSAPALARTWILRRRAGPGRGRVRWPRLPFGTAFSGPRPSCQGRVHLSLDCPPTALRSPRRLVNDTARPSRTGRCAASRRYAPLLSFSFCPASFAACPTAFAASAAFEAAASAPSLDLFPGLRRRVLRRLAGVLNFALDGVSHWCPPGVRSCRGGEVAEVIRPGGRDIQRSIWRAAKGTAGQMLTGHRTHTRYRSNRRNRGENPRHRCPVALGGTHGPGRL
jgi:hypothetical protein